MAGQVRFDWNGDSTEPQPPPKPVDPFAAANAQGSFYAPPPSAAGIGAPPTPGPGFGGAPAFGNPAAFNPGSSYGAAPSQPHKAGMPSWAIALIAVVGSFLVIGILAAVAIPVFLNQRNAEFGVGEPLPETVAGYSKINDPSFDAGFEQMLNGLPAEMRSATQIAAYGNPTNPKLMVMTIKANMPIEAQRQAFMLGFQKSAGMSGVTSMPGPDGTTGSCGYSPDLSACLTVDNKSVVAALDLGGNGTANYEGLLAVRTDVASTID